jgi:hypothetical protein
VVHRGPGQELGTRATPAGEDASFDEVVQRGGQELEGYRPPAARGAGRRGGRCCVVAGRPIGRLRAGCPPYGLLDALGHALALAKEIPGAELLTQERTGHELPRAVWDVVVPAILRHTAHPGTPSLGGGGMF